MGRESALDLHVIGLEVAQYLGELLMDPALQDCGDAFKLGELVSVNEAPVTTLHQLVKAPED